MIEWLLLGVIGCNCLVLVFAREKQVKVGARPTVIPRVDIRV